VHEQRVFAAQLMAQLADGLQKRERFDIAHGAPISTITTSMAEGSPAAPETRRTAALISLVTCGITCTVLPR